MCLRLYFLRIWVYTVLVLRILREGAAPVRTNSDFSKGSVSGAILRLAVPMVLAQLVNILYNIVDRMYIGHIPEASVDALTGVGVTFPILQIVAAFANLFGTGGTPLFSMARGAAQHGADEAQRRRASAVMNNTFSMLVLTGAVLTVLVLLVKRPVLYLFGASDVTYPYANDYISIYMLGSVFVMVSLGMNGFINAQGFANKGMLTVLIGAVINIALDPLLIFALGMGVRGAALATVISQLVSALWVVRFLTGKRTLFRLDFKHMRPQRELVFKIVSLGISGFIVNFTSSAVQIVCNAMLSQFGGDLYVGVMTVINSIREITYAPVNGITSASNPVIGFNYGAGEYRRVRKAIQFVTVLCVSFMFAVWLVLMLFPRAFISIFNDDPTLTETCVSSMFIYFFGCFMMSLQMAGQTVSQSLGRAKQAVFFSLLRKVFIVIPLTLLLPYIPSVDVNGVFLAEPISNFIGGSACYIAMLCTVWRELKRKEKESQEKAAQSF